jgi:site-specific recombinase XerD
LSEKGKAGSTLNVYHMAIRFLFTQVLDKKMWVDIKYSKTPESLPEVLSKEEVRKIFENIKNPKHSFMITLMYSAGLRVSELLNLRVCDLNLNEGHGYVRKGKGGKDRLFILSKRLIPVLKRIIDIERLKEEDLIFKSNRNKKYSPRTIQEIIKKACKKAGIKKKIHPHTLRHSFATHLIENGYSVSDVQTLLGHKSPETTMIYLHTASKNMLNIKSPLDSLQYG